MRHGTFLADPELVFTKNDCHNQCIINNQVCVILYDDHVNVEMIAYLGVLQ